MEKQKSFWDHYKYGTIISGVLIIIVGVICFYSEIANFFFIDNPKGELLKVLITIVGGFAVFIGLMLNSDRIKAQTEQNTISKTSNFDKRFGDAIGYLGSDNTSIVLGGIYALYQLAKEDERYKSIVAGLYTSFIREKSEELYSKLDNEISKRSLTKAKPPIEIETIISLLFSSKSLFYGEFLDLSNTTLSYANFYGDIDNCSFECSVFKGCTFHSSILNCSFKLIKFEHSHLGSTTSIIDNCNFWGMQCDELEFKGILNSNLDFQDTTLKNCKFSPNKMHNCSFLNAEIKGTSFCNIDSFKGTTFSKKEKEKLNLEYCIDDEIGYC